jgi:hypothetical protein
MEYTVVTSEKLDDFIFVVNEYMKKGWVPIGGISLNTFVPGKHYLQAMTKA